MKKSELQNIAISDIVVEKQVRRQFDEDPLIELKASIKEKGVLQPIGVRLVNGEVKLIYGERRYRAASEILKEDPTRKMIPAVVFQDISDDEAFELQIIENLHRKDVHPLEEADAFKKMLDSGKYTVEEISLRVSRPMKYIGGRLKLNDLIEDLQKALYKDRMTMKTALQLCKISADGQKDFYEGWLEWNSKDDIIGLEENDLSQYMNDLKKAPFDIKDPTINKTAGACISCPHNTSGNLLFPDEAGKSICTNEKCFLAKCKTSFANKVKEAVEDPNVILVNASYYGDDDDVKKIKSDGNRVYSRHEVTESEKPKKSDIATGAVLKAFVVIGDKKGKYIYVAINKKSSSESDGTATSKLTAAGFKEKQSEGKITEKDIKGEIERIESAEKRKKEIDGEKSWPAIYELLESEDSEFENNSKALFPAEKVAMIVALVDRTHWSNDFDDLFEAKGYKGNINDAEFSDWLISNPKLLDECINQLSRIFLYTSTSAAFKNDDPGQAALLKVIPLYNSKGLNEKLSEIKAVQDVRMERVNESINKLKKQLAEKPKAAATKAPVKKTKEATV